MGRIDELSVNTIRLLAADAVEKAKSGHPGMPMGDAAMAYALWMKFLRHNPKNPLWQNRDRFVLSAGHGSMLLYSLLHLTGHNISIGDIKNFRQWESKTPGHPEYCPERGIETTTGPLGQGFATGVGMAVAERYLSEMFNRPGFPIVDYNIYGIVSDGDLMEGVSAEAASLSGHLRLGKIIYLYSDNKITIEGSTDLSFTEDVEKRFQAYGWHTQRVDGDDLKAVEKAINAAKKEKDRPSLILARTRIGCGSPTKEGSAETHGTPLGPDEIRLIKKCMGFPDKDFYIPKDVLLHMRKSVGKGRALEGKWSSMFKRWSAKYPELRKMWDKFASRELPLGWEKSLPGFKPVDGPIATRSASGKVLNSIADALPQLIGGSADLAPSNNTYLKKYADFGIKAGGRNLHFGVREHAMGAVLNGMALSRMLIPYGGTFLVFSDYLRPSERLAALMGLRVIYVFTHDSIGLGEDGPTHQPVEHLTGLRAMPNMTVIRPADANETVEAWKAALRHKEGPVALILSRQGLPVIDRKVYAPASNLGRGAFILSDSKGTPEIILISSGAEVHLCLEAAGVLRKQGVDVRVVNMPSFELFEKQDKAYKGKVLPEKAQRRLAVEAASSLPWHKYVGLKGAVIGIDRFGASAPAKTLFKEFGFTVENIVRHAHALRKAKA
ncbi:MAG: transketolase [Thermodesulfovibrionales bacterium]|nr:transketolase [Thermodesulfovibrionales bacterium]